MQRRPLLLALMATLTAPALTACGGGGGGDTPDTPPTTPQEPGRLRVLADPLLRAEHVSVTLPDGSLLVTGGSGAASASPTLVLGFELTSERFVARGELLTGRFRHSATALSSQALLVCGGLRTLTGAPVAERLDLRSGQSQATAGQPAFNRYDHTATRLPDGRVLLVGGRRGAGTAPTDIAELYDPQSDRFETLTARLAQGRSGHGAVWLDGERLLILGGVGADASALLPEVFHLPTRSFQPLAAPALAGAPRYDSVALRSAGGHVLLMGGASPLDEPQAQVLGVQAGPPLQARTASLREPRRQLAAAALADGRVLVTGGQTSARGEVSAATELFDPATGLSRVGPTMASPRYGHTADRLADGRVLIIGGYNATNGHVGAVEAFS